MAEFPAFPLWTDAYLGDTTHLTTIEHGAYFLLLVTLWRSKEPIIPNDDKLLARYTRLTAGQWKRIRPILEPFFTISPDGWRQGRLTDEWYAVRQHSTKQSNRAKGRWLKNKKTTHAVAMPDGCRSDASPSLPLPEVSKKEESKKTPLPPDGGSVSKFDIFFDTFPKKRIGNKTKARSAWDKAINEGRATEEEILHGLESYRDCDEVRRGFAKGAAAWLNDDGWRKDYSAPAGKHSNANTGPSIDEQADAIEQAIRDGKI